MYICVCVYVYICTNERMVFLGGVVSVGRLAGLSCLGYMLYLFSGSMAL